MEEFPPPPGTSPDVTSLLRLWSSGDEAARDSLFSQIYPELRQLASRQLRRKNSDISLQATELVNEAYLRLVDQQVSDWRCRAHFFAIGATVMRRVLLDRAKYRHRKKRWPEGRQVSLEQVDIAAPMTESSLIELDEALTELSKFQALAARIVELRFFAGLNIEEVASILSLGTATVGRKWRFARAWLAKRLDIAP